ncbi:MAG: TatD family hydrolase [Alphaproteobacteria bacterium]
MLVDSHCHLDFPDFDANRSEIIQAARDAGVQRIVTICTRMDKFENVLKIANEYPDVFIGAGVHPLEAGEAGLTSAQPLLDIASNPKVVGTGETGLDYHYQAETREQQIKNFEVHIEAAQETGLPLIVHTRDADEDTIAILKAGHALKPFPCVIHCFTRDQKLADACLDMGHYISFSGILTFNSAKEIQAVAATMPLDRMVVETDSPYLAPVPKRGKGNQPAYVAHTAAFLAKLRGLEVEELHKITGDNFFRLFSKVPVEI